MSPFFRPFSIKGKFYVAFMWLAPLLLAAQDDQALAPVTGTYAITHATVVVSPGKKIDDGTVVIRDGLIIAVGRQVAIPADALIIKADSMYVYAGFIDGYSHTGVSAPKEGSKEKVKYPDNPPPDRAGINPHIDVRDFLNPSDRTVTELRGQGFTMSQVVPQGNLLPGQAALVLLGEGSADQLVVQGKSALYSELTGATGVYPSTVMGVMAKWRELYRQASLAKNYEASYAANPAGLERPASDRMLQAFYPVIEKRQPVLFKSEKVIEAQRVLKLKSDFGFDLLMADLKEGWPIIERIKGSGAGVFLSLELPEEIKGDKKEGKENTSSAEKKALEEAKGTAVANYTSQAALFSKAGIRFGFSANSVKVDDISTNLRRMVAAGLSEDAALAALTTTPAQMLGVANRMGTVESGKMANLIVTNKSYFVEKTSVKYIFVEGKLYTNAGPKKSASGTKGNIAGSWTYTTETQQGKGGGKLVIKESAGSFSGTITNNFSGKEAEVKEILLDGNSLSFNYMIDAGGNQMRIEVTVQVQDDRFEGSMTAGQFGTFPMNGTRDPK